MLKLLQESILLLAGYILIQIILCTCYLITKIFKTNKDNDLILIDIQEWKEIQIKNDRLKKEREILTIENRKLEKLNREIILELKDK